MKRATSAAKRNATRALETAAERAGTAKGDAAGVCAVAFALLEVAYQLGRIADNVPVYGPAEERE